MSSLDRLFKLLSALESKNIPNRLDRHGPNEVTVTFIWQDHLIEAEYDADSMWFAHFRKAPNLIDATALMAFLAERWHDETDAPTSSSPVWLNTSEPFEQLMAFTGMLDGKKITWRLDSLAPKRISVFFTVIDARVEANLDRAGLTFTVYDGSEDVFPEKDLPAVAPGLQLGV